MIPSLYKLPQSQASEINCSTYSYVRTYERNKFTMHCACFIHVTHQTELHCVIKAIQPHRKRGDITGSVQVMQ